MAGEFSHVAQGPAVYEFIRSRLDPSGRLLEPGVALPDEAKIAAGGLQWVAGGLDGARGHHSVGGGASASKADQVAALFAKAARRPTRRRLKQLYDMVSADGALDYVDLMINRLALLNPAMSRIHQLGRWLAMTAPDHEAVKVGLAILGVTSLGDDLAVTRALGAHDEFTLYAAVAIRNGVAEPDRELWALAQFVDGWGRIQCVERLRETTDPEICSWILRRGYRNSIMYEYLAFIAATTGDLATALRGASVDRELLTAAGEILSALVAGGPAEDLDDYGDGPQAVETFLGHMLSRAETLDDFHAVSAIETFLAKDDGWESRRECGWTESRCLRLRAHCTTVLNRSEWTDKIAEGLRSEDRVTFWQADHAARIRGIDTFHLHFQKLAKDPFEGPWFQAWQQADESRARRLVDLARRTLPLEAIGTGPSDEHGLGIEWRSHRALDWTLQALRDYAGIGGDLVLVGLRSPTTRNRNTALNALKAWPQRTWPDEAWAAVGLLADSDPNGRTRHLARETLTGPPT